MTDNRVTLKALSLHVISYKMVLKNLKDDQRRNFYDSNPHSPLGKAFIGICLKITCQVSIVSQKNFPQLNCNEEWTKMTYLSLSEMLWSGAQTGPKQQMELLDSNPYSPLVKVYIGTCPKITCQLSIVSWKNFSQLNCNEEWTKMTYPKFQRVQVNCQVLHKGKFTKLSSR